MALGAIPPALKKPYVGGQGYTNVGFGKLVNFGGTISAVDATTNQITWQINTPSSAFCYGGTTTTGGGLLWYGTVDGNFHARRRVDRQGAVVAEAAVRRRRSADHLHGERQAVRRDRRRRQHHRLRQGHCTRTATVCTCSHCPASPFVKAWQNRTSQGPPGP